MKSLVLITVLTVSSFLNLMAQTDKHKRHFLKFDSTYVMIDDNIDNWFTLEINADTLEENEDNLIIYNNKKLLQINVIPFSKILPNQKKPIAITKVLKAYKKWELDYHQNLLGVKLKSGEELYFHNDKPFLIWWQKNPPDKTKRNSSVKNEKEYDVETGSVVSHETLNVTYMLCLSFSIYGAKNVALTIPVFENENLKDEMEKLKEVAKSLRVYGGPIDLDVLVDIKTSKQNYVLRDSLNLFELSVPDWLKVITPYRNNMFASTFPEKKEVVNAMMMVWEYASDSLSFQDFINRSKTPHKTLTNYRLIEERDSILRYFCTSDNGWFYQQGVYLKGTGIYCLIIFTATRNTYDLNVERFEEILNKIVLK